jgi:hypothetical protein
MSMLKLTKDSPTIHSATETRLDLATPFEPIGLDPTKTKRPAIITGRSAEQPSPDDFALKCAGERATEAALIRNVYT